MEKFALAREIDAIIHINRIDMFTDWMFKQLDLILSDPLFYNVIVIGEAREINEIPDYLFGPHKFIATVEIHKLTRKDISTILRLYAKNIAPLCDFDIYEWIEQLCNDARARSLDGEKIVSLYQKALLFAISELTDNSALSILRAKKKKIIARRYLDLALESVLIRSY